MLGMMIQATIGLEKIKGGIALLFPFSYRFTDAWLFQVRKDTWLASSITGRSYPLSENELQTMIRIFTTNLMSFCGKVPKMQRRSAFTASCIPLRLSYLSTRNFWSLLENLAVMHREWLLLSCFGQMPRISHHLEAPSYGRVICFSEMNQSIDGQSLRAIWETMLHIFRR